MIGVDRILDVIAGSAPSPADRSRWIDDKGNEVACDPDGPFSAYVFKTYVDPYAGRLSVLRVVSGRCRSDEALTNPRTGSSERLGGISHLVGKERIPVDEAIAGDVIAITKLKDTNTFDTLCRPETQITFPPVELDRKSTRLNSSHANISYAVFCLKKKKTKIVILTIILLKFYY